MAAAAAWTLSGLPSAPGAAEGRWGGGGLLHVPSSGCWDRGSWGRAGVRGLSSRPLPRTLSGAQGRPLCAAGWPRVSRKAGRTSNARPLLVASRPTYPICQDGSQNRLHGQPFPTSHRLYGALLYRGDLPTQSKGQGGARVGRQELGWAGGVPVTSETESGREGAARAGSTRKGPYAL